MPPKPKITKEMILSAALAITRESGFEAVNARSVAGRLQCSTRPIFTCYANMAELKTEFLAFAFDYYTQYTMDCKKTWAVSPALLLPLSYIGFAEEETHLFRLLFISDMDLDMKKAEDFYKEVGNEQKAAEFSEWMGLPPERGKEIFLHLFFYAHGIAVLTATGKLSFDRADSEKMLRSFLECIYQGA